MSHEMSDGAQYAVVGLVVLAAVGYVIRRAWQLLRGRAAIRCSGCAGNCPVTRTLTSLEVPAPPAADTSTHHVSR